MSVPQAVRRLLAGRPCQTASGTARTPERVMFYADRRQRRRGVECRGEVIMTFYDLLEQVLALLQRHHRLSYRALELQFPLLDPSCIDALRDELLFQGVARDAEGQGLIWLGRTSVMA